jgi:hypothetical protein
LRTDRPSLFQRLRRYARTPSRDPQEDRLTEALAVTLDAAPEAARYLASVWFDVELSEELTVRTQLYEDGDRVDLELLFGAESHPERRIWIESKVGSTADSEQGERYIRRLLARGDPWSFGWLTADPGWALADLPEGARAHTWQELAVTLRDWLGGPLRGKLPTDYGARLVEEFIRHLREEELGYTEAFGKADADALTRYRPAVARVHEVMRGAVAALETRWGEPLGQGVRGCRPDGWWVFSKSPSAGPVSPWPNYSDEWPREHPYFELHLRRDDGRLQPRGEWVVGAGATFQTRWAPSSEEVEEWLGTLSQKDFEYGGEPGTDHVYLFRYKPLSALEGSDLGSQASALAEWAESTFKCLNLHPPPTEVER